MNYGYLIATGGEIPATGAPTMPTAKSYDERLVALELLVTHLERDLGALNLALLSQQKQIDAISRSIERLEGRIARIADADTPHNPADERPPHY